MCLWKIDNHGSRNGTGKVRMQFRAGIKYLVFIVDPFMHLFKKFRMNDYGLKFYKNINVV